MTFNEDLSPLQNGEEAANNLSETLATEPKGITQKGLLYDLAIQTVLRTFEEITSARKNNKWVCFREWLQREEQVKKWNSKDKKAAKSYLQGVFQTLGVTEEFLICDIDFLIRDIEAQKLSQPKLKKLWDKMLKWLVSHRELGVEFVILDGQNRINHALVPFRYNNLAISLAYNGYVHENVTYSSLDDYTRQQINERQFRNIYRKALSKKGDTTENLIALLESRLDTVIYRAKFAPTVFSARQMINHGHIKVNKKRVNISSYVVKNTDLIEIREKSKKLTFIEGSLQSKEREVPEYIQLDDKNKTAKLVRVPKFAEVPFPVIMEPSLVIEYYSR